MFIKNNLRKIELLINRNQMYNKKLEMKQQKKANIEKNIYELLIDEDDNIEDIKNHEININKNKDDKLVNNKKNLKNNNSELNENNNIIDKHINKEEIQENIINDKHINKEEIQKENKKQENILLHTSWDLYIHEFPSNNWSPTSYDYIYEIKDIYDFWKLFNNIHKIDSYSSNIFVMRSGVGPIWESDDNRNGGECSICIDAEKGYDLFSLLSMLIMSEHLVNDPNIINGISIVTKKITTHENPDGNNLTYIKIWTRTKFREIRNIVDKNINHKYPHLSIVFKEYEKPDKKGRRKLQY